MLTGQRELRSQQLSEIPDKSTMTQTLCFKTAISLAFGESSLYSHSQIASSVAMSHCGSSTNYGRHSSANYRQINDNSTNSGSEIAITQDFQVSTSSL
jgi:hypothetical protein